MDDLKVPKEVPSVGKDGSSGGAAGRHRIIVILMPSIIYKNNSDVLLDSENKDVG